MRRRWLERGFVVLSLVATGCYGSTSDDDDGDGDGNGLGTCSAFSACGGDPTGAWQAQSYCVEEGFDEIIAAQGLPPACAGAMAVTGLIAGTLLTVEAETYSETGSVSIEWDYQFDTSCVSALAGQAITSSQMPQFCSAFQDTLLSDPSSPFVSVACEVVSNVCVCDAVQQIAVDSGGTYTVQDGTLLFEDGSMQAFCVDGDEMRVRGEDEVLGGAIATYARVTR